MTPQGKKPTEEGGSAAARPQWMIWLVVAVGVGVLLSVGAGPVAGLLRGPDPPVSTPAPSASASQDQVFAERIRQEAFKDCAASQWQDCREKLDDARSYDRDGEKDPRVVAARAAAEKGLASPPPRPPDAGPPKMPP